MVPAIRARAPSHHNTLTRPVDAGDRAGVGGADVESVRNALLAISGVTRVTVDADGNVYGADFLMNVRKFVKK